MQLLRDNGDTPWYGDGIIAKDLSQDNFKKFRSDQVTLGAVTVDTTTPAIGSLTPADDATDVTPSNNLAVNFAEPVQRGTGAIVIKRSADDSVFESFDTATSSLLAIGGAQVSIDPAR